uniref:Uncharacterized protein n=1 Tax=Panagrolaimus superbus TaxID=310955 RepID=A0A914Y4H8_9BILA
MIIISALILNLLPISHENDVYKTSNVDSSPANKQPLASAVSQLSNSYGMQQQQAPAPSQQQQQPRRTAFGYAETSTVSYPPESRPAVNTAPAAPVTTTPTLSNYTKPAVTAQSSYSHTQQHPQQMQQQQPIHQQHTSQQQMYNPMYGGYPYVNLYSPVAGRAEDTPYATPYMPYAAAYGMDVNSLAQMMPQMHALQAAVPNHHQQPQTTHRADHHQNFNDMKQNYGQSAAANPNVPNVNPTGQRDANITSTNVPPPPGFSGPPANHMFPNQHHLAHMFNYPTMFMKTMPNQMYGGQQNVDDSLDARHQTQAKMYQQDKYSNGSNVRDRMAMGGAGAQPTPPPAQGGYGQQQPSNYAGNGQMNSVLNSKKPYHGNQWSNQ